MPYRLFLDDERFPTDDGWVIVRSFQEATEQVQKFGIPEFCSFDHDLGDGPTGYDFTLWLIDQHLDGNYVFPSNFEFYVHSMNPIGAENIRQTLLRFLEHITCQTL